MTYSFCPSGPPITAPGEPYSEQFLRAVYYLAPLADLDLTVWSHVDTASHNLKDARIDSRQIRVMLDALDTFQRSYNALVDELGVTEDVVDLARQVIPLVDRMNDLYKHIAYPDPMPTFLAQMEAAGCVMYPDEPDAPTCPACGPGATRCQLGRVFPGPSAEVQAHTAARDAEARRELYRRALRRVRAQGGEVSR